MKVINSTKKRKELQKALVKEQIQIAKKIMKEDSCILRALSGKKDQTKNYRLIKKYGITLDEYNALLKSQNSRCFLCGDLPKSRSLCVDHLHMKDSKGKQIVGDRSLTRGLLCMFCNKYIVGAIEHRNSVPARDIIHNLQLYANQYRLKGDF